MNEKSCNTSPCISHGSDPSRRHVVSFYFLFKIETTKVKFKSRDLSNSTPFTILHTNVSCDQDELYLRYRASPAVVHYISVLRETYTKVCFRSCRLNGIDLIDLQVRIISCCTIIYTSFLTVTLITEP